MTYKANDPTLKSWVEVPQNSDFPIQNLPYGIFSTKDKSPRAGVAIGDNILDLNEIQYGQLFKDLNLPDRIFDHPILNDFMELGKEVTVPVRERISELLQYDNQELQGNDQLRNKALIPQKEATMHLPIRVGDYTDFYSSESHATNVGTMFRDPDNALLPNWKHIPVGYHGRASSIVISGTPLHRPKGQTIAPDAKNPDFGPAKLVDFELEMAFITCGGNTLGDAISTKEAENHIFGFTLFNDWSARDIQKWEYVPLGPFLAKNFGSSMSPWIVTMEALEPFKIPGPKQEPEVLPYLKFAGDYHFDIDLQVGIQPKDSEEKVVTNSNFKYMYWNVVQQLAHHTVNGCNINTGDVYASGTISGNDPSSYGSMLELSWKGSKPVQMADGTERKFINDHDTVIMRGHGEKDGVRIGFGEVRTELLPTK
ncbi:fumarylacetoacetate hydrolase [Marivirga sericea]|uniref:fumarylacetoacetase n=1 Tax=Marivirga sericea TaxID=1028 RepID=A0A1X7K9Q0_9BACT|nr:fumarylacetoacetase [Marivirga sericea]SMG37509.1 fumarylacetoacetate hydrolase [Marivirga sericea]